MLLSSFIFKLNLFVLYLQRMFELFYFPDSCRFVATDMKKKSDGGPGSYSDSKAMQLPGRPSYFVRATDLYAASLLIVLNTVQAVERTMKRIFVTDI